MFELQRVIVHIKLEDEIEKFFDGFDGLAEGHVLYRYPTRITLNDDGEPNYQGILLAEPDFPSIEIFKPVQQSNEDYRWNVTSDGISLRSFGDCPKDLINQSIACTVESLIKFYNHGRDEYVYFIRMGEEKRNLIYRLNSEEMDLFTCLTLTGFNPLFIDKTSPHYYTLVIQQEGQYLPLKMEQLEDKRQKIIFGDKEYGIFDNVLDTTIVFLGFAIANNLYLCLHKDLDKLNK